MTKGLYLELRSRSTAIFTCVVVSRSGQKRTFPMSGMLPWMKPERMMSFGTGKDAFSGDRKPPQIGQRAGCTVGPIWPAAGATIRRPFGSALGFRPAMEYLGSVSCSPDTLVGKAIKAYFSGGVSIEGCLVDFSDYDIILKPVTPIPADCPRAVKDGCNIVVSRDNIIWLKES